MKDFRPSNYSDDKNAHQILFLEELLNSQELRDQFFMSAISPSSDYHEVDFPEEVVAILNNPALFDERFWYKNENFWVIDPVLTSIPIIYRADPTVTAAFALGTLVGHLILAGAVGAASGVATNAVKKK